MTDAPMLVFLGLVAGVASGVIGIGGGVILVPSLVFLFGYSQHRAEGTTLAILVPPIGLLAVMPYFKHGYVDIRAAALICAGFFAGGLIGGHFATSLSNAMLQRIFGVALLVIGARMLMAAR